MKKTILCILTLFAIHANAAETTVLNCGPYSLKKNAQNEYLLMGTATKINCHSEGCNYEGTTQIKLSKMTEDLDLYLAANPNPVVKTGITAMRSTVNSIRVYSETENGFDLKDPSKLMPQLHQLQTASPDLMTKSVGISDSWASPVFEAIFDGFRVQIYCTYH